ncbi:DUF3995 domain-containing protein [Geodermatophilus sp. DSM 44513]|uniref:DUF3995 domain-containing protein n=1 Tax=Geodermatophilus sp. DSM 44513 TaxID=1528104 RepID=UPI001411EF11|nr:DUF3995 domain-containing protein [Geodermatophilus sp. DSM 44513]WNV76828.1 DUF3995 domain-containing protein [Geodermatophilus sp. DSM 44513]
MRGSLRTSATGWALLAAAWCASFAALHVYWALGGGVGLAQSAGAELARTRPTAFVLVGLWGVAALLSAGSTSWCALALGRPRGRRLRVAAIVTGSAAGVLLLVRALVVQGVLLLDAGGVASSVGPDQTRWSLWLWNPWFLLGGAAFLVAAHHLARSLPTESHDRQP